MESTVEKLMTEDDKIEEEISEEELEEQLIEKAREQEEELFEKQYSLLDKYKSIFLSKAPRKILLPTGSSKKKSSNNSGVTPRNGNPRTLM